MIAMKKIHLALASLALGCLPAAGWAGETQEHKSVLQFGKPAALQQANEYYRLGKIEESLGFYDKALDEDMPKFMSYEANTNYCAALIEAGRYFRAKNQCKMAIDIVPWKWAAHYNLGVALTRLGLYELAISEFEIARLKSPQNVEITKALSDVRKQLEDIAPYVRKKAELGGLAT